MFAGNEKWCLWREENEGELGHVISTILQAGLEGTSVYL
jgi:hypothetical protein